MSSTDLNPIHVAKPTLAMTMAYHLRLRGTVNGSAASSTAPPNSIASRVMFEPICELISQTRTTETPYTAAVIRTVFHFFGTSA